MSVPLTPALAQALLAATPEHSRTSCSDDSTNNGYGSSSSDWPRCERCLLLEVVQGRLPAGATAYLQGFNLRCDGPGVG